MQNLDVKIWLSVVTVPFVLGYLALREGAKALQAMGENSEEVFRGDRLPVLNVAQKEEEGQ